MEPFEAEAEFYSPRWGHNDTYVFKFSMESLQIVHGARTSTAVWQDNADPQWRGEGLTGIMQNDSIYPPAGIEGLIEHLWRAWRNGELSSADTQNELSAFAAYVNASTKAKPKTDFWRGIF